MEELSPGEVRARTFRAALRGFDRSEVERYLDLVANYLEALQQQLHQAGVTELLEPHDLAAEYAAVGEEVAGVLAEARAAADAMRARAAADAASWRTDAEEELRQSQAETAAAIRQARESVWVTGTEMLDQVVAECEALVADARESAMRIRSESERDAGRMMTDAQREREELVRTGREEADRTVNAARKEADSLLMGARHQADVAAERVRALEERRAELMEELDVAQKALLGLDEAPQQPETEGAEAEADAEDVPATRSHWPEDDGGVRIVSARPSVPEEPVDADALAAEVEALRGGRTPVSPPVGGSPAAGGEDRSSEPPSPAAEPPPPPQAAEKAPEPVVEEGEPPPSHPEEEEETPEEPEPDPLAGLFDELRSTPIAEVSDNGGRTEEPEPSPAADAAAKLDAAATGVAVATEEPKPETAPPPAPIETAVDPFALRDRLLLPVQNRALRLVKRQLVAAQNRALEELRLDPDWVPAGDLVDGEIGGVLSDLVAESTAAGFAAAAELLGRPEAPDLELEADDPTEEFTRAFVDAASLSLERSRSSGAGKREASSSLSRVFRAWRTDDAERRVRLLSRRAYHDGVLAALLAMDCDRVSVAPLGRTCVDHSEASSPWPITEGPPAGILVPPASLECSCTLVPDC